MATDTNADLSNGYNDVADEFMSVRSTIGTTTVRRWSNVLKPGGAVLDIGCGHGFPISQALSEAGFDVHGIDASPRLIAAFRERLPQAHSECAAVEHSRLSNRNFDGVVACGLIFLLPPETQAKVIAKVASALNPGGHFLFTAPHQECEWLDNLTKQKSISLGASAYRRILQSEGLTFIGDAEDEAQNHYYFACTSSND
jgi:2-polyprenyl-3-methyl-5-hydroxy-6-metoxy-1,4-benzoquinol methylase